MQVHSANSTAENLFGFPIWTLFDVPLRRGLFFGKPYFTEYLECGVVPKVEQNKPFVVSENTLKYGFRSLPGTLMGRTWVERIENYLLKAEVNARTIQEREAYQLARQVVVRCWEGNSTNPFELAHCWMYGGSPEVIAYRQAHFLAFTLGTEYPKRPKKPVVSFADEALPQEALPPKKPCVSVRKTEQEDKERA